MNKAVELDPNSSVAHRIYALFLTYLGRHDESIAEIKIAIDLEPASVLNHHDFRTRFCFFARRYDEAVIELERTAEMEPNFFRSRTLILAYRFKGEDDEAFECFVQAEISRRRAGRNKFVEINLCQIRLAGNY